MAGLNIADVLLSSAKGIGTGEPKVEQLLAKLKKLQQDKRALGEEIQEIQAVKESLQKELETLQTESLQLGVIHKEKEELCQKLHYLCEESEQDFAGQLRHNKSTEDLSEQYNCEIQAIKLKHRKLRMKFETHLYQLIEQQKNLYSVFMPDKIPSEIENAENTKSQLSNAEKLKATQVNSLGEQIEKWKQEQQDPQSVVVQEE